MVDTPKKPEPKGDDLKTLQADVVAAEAEVMRAETLLLEVAIEFDNRDADEDDLEVAARNYSRAVQAHGLALVRVRREKAKKAVANG